MLTSVTKKSLKRLKQRLSLQNLILIHTVEVIFDKKNV